MAKAMQGPAPAVRTAVRCTYAVAGAIWLGALAFAGYRLYQMRTLTPLEAEVLKSGVDSYTTTRSETDWEGFATQSETEVHVPVVWVRYRFHGKTYTVEARHDTSGLKWIQERIARRWKPGERIRIHIDPGDPGKPVPDLGLNLHTFQMSFVLLFAGCVFALFGYGAGRLMVSVSGMVEQKLRQYGPGPAAEAARVEAPPARAPTVADDEPLPVPMGTVKALAGVVCCVASPLFDPLGYVLTVLGTVLLWGGATFPAAARLAATAVLLPPRIAPLLIAALAGPGEFSFVLDPRAPAMSSSAWGWYGLLWAVFAVLLLMFSERGSALLAGAGLGKAAAPGTRHEHAPVLLIVPGLLVLGWATNALLGLKNDFEWVEPANAGSWQLKHSVRGRVASFTAPGVASIEGREEGSREKPVYHIRFALQDGTRALATRSLSAFGELRKLAATAELAPGRMRLRYGEGTVWTNGAFSLKDRIGRYEAAGGGFVDLRLDAAGRLAGTASMTGGTAARAMRAIKVTEEGGIEYRTGIFGSTAGNFEGERLVIGGVEFRKSRQ